MNPLEKLLRFLADLDERKIFHSLSRVRPEAIMVEVAVPGERWEIEFFGEGQVEVEIFRNAKGEMGGAEMLARLLAELDD